MVLGFFLVAPALYAQDDEDPEGPEVEQSQEREARRAERQRQIGSLSDEQRQALLSVAAYAKAAEQGNAVNVRRAADLQLVRRRDLQN